MSLLSESKMYIFHTSRIAVFIIPYLLHPLNEIVKTKSFIFRAPLRSFDEKFGFGFQSTKRRLTKYRRKNISLIE